MANSSPTQDEKIAALEAKVAALESDLRAARDRADDRSARLVEVRADRHSDLEVRLLQTKEEIRKEQREEEDRRFKRRDLWLKVAAVIIALFGGFLTKCTSDLHSKITNALQDSQKLVNDATARADEVTTTASKATIVAGDASVKAYTLVTEAKDKADRQVAEVEKLVKTYDSEIKDFEKRTEDMLAAAKTNTLNASTLAPEVNRLGDVIRTLVAKVNIDPKLVANSTDEIPKTVAAYLQVTGANKETGPLEGWIWLGNNPQRSETVADAKTGDFPRLEKIIPDTEWIAKAPVNIRNPQPVDEFTEVVDAVFRGDTVKVVQGPSKGPNGTYYMRVRVTRGKPQWFVYLTTDRDRDAEPVTRNEAEKYRREFKERAINQKVHVYAKVDRSRWAVVAGEPYPSEAAAQKLLNELSKKGYPRVSSSPMTAWELADSP